MNTSLRVRRSKTLGDRPVMALGIVAGTVTAAAGALLALLLSTGWTPAPAAATAAQHPAQVPTVQLQNSPANQLLTAVLATPPAGWTVSGVARSGLTPPAPFSCMKDGTTPAISLTEHVNSNGNGFDVTITAYTAGGGASAFRTLIAAAANCGSGKVSITGGGTAGVESSVATITRGSASSTVIASRRGDVISYVADNDAAAAAARAKELDQTLEPRLGAICATESSSADDGKRNPFSIAGYTPYRVGQRVTIAERALPTVPAGASYQAVPLTQQLPLVLDVTPTASPSYPVWPLMPAAVAQPKKPTPPAEHPPTSAVTMVLTEDSAGPGCGWAFTGMRTPRFDTSAAKKANTAALADAKTKLTTSAKKWQLDVLAYWTAIPGYVNAIPAYATYVEQVGAVNNAWAGIAEQWNQYTQAHAAWQARVTAAAQLTAQQKTAQQQYDKAYAACMATPDETPTPTPTPTPSDTPTPGPSDGSTGEPTNPPAGAATAPSNVDKAAECKQSVPRSGILDVPVQDPGAEPQKPADPRPADKR